MGWYSAGTISVTNGNKTVTGSSTAFVANVKSGFALVGPDGRIYEIDTVDSATQLTLKTNYQGATASGQSYAIFPTQGVIADLATQAASLITSFATVRDGVGSGLHPDGSAATPAIRFSADQDTGLYRPASNTVAVVTGGTERIRVSSTGFIGIGVTAPALPLDIAGQGIRVTSPEDHSGHVRVANSGRTWAAGMLGVPGWSRYSIYDVTASAERLAVESTSGATRPGTDNNLSLGTSSFRWSVVYSGTGAINTSDAREKTWRGALSDDEYAAGLQVLAELGFYQWNDAIAAKGPEGARYHFGIAAQTVWEIFAAHGLVDPIDEDGKPGETPYGFLCWDEWDEEAEPELGAGNCYGVRTDELALFLHAVLARRQAELEARIEALEGEGGE